MLLILVLPDVQAFGPVISAKAGILKEKRDSPFRRNDRTILNISD